MTHFTLLTELNDLIPQRVFKEFAQNPVPVPETSPLFVTLKAFLTPPGEVLDTLYTVYFLLSDVYNNLQRIAFQTEPQNEADQTIDTEFLVVLTKLMGMGPMTYQKTADFILDVSRLDIDPSSSGGDFILDVSRLDIDPASSGNEIVILPFPNPVIARCIQAYALFFAGNCSRPLLQKSLVTVFNSPPAAMYWESLGFVTNVYLEAMYSTEVNVGLLRYTTPSGSHLYLEPSYGRVQLIFK